MSSQTPLRLVVKVGTSTLTNASGGMDRGFLSDLTRQLAIERSRGAEVILVSSGAIRAGRDVLRRTSAPLSLPDTLPYKQAAAAIGQGQLMHAYTEAFAWRDVNCAQILLTRDDLSDRRRFLNARNTLLALLSLGVIPIINENDTVAVDEIKFGDNDNLAALVATLVSADLLLILSDVAGLYAVKPEADKPEPPLIPIVERVDAKIIALAGGAQSQSGTGGMRTKVEAARIATEAGIRTVIAPGRRENVIHEVMEGRGVGTQFLAQSSAERLPARKRWIAHGARSRGSVTVNERARLKLQSSGVSLLAVGITAVQGTFHSGDLIEIQNESGAAFGRGLANYASTEVRQVLGLHSEKFEEVLGYRGFEEIVHRDNLVIED